MVSKINNNFITKFSGHGIFFDKNSDLFLMPYFSRPFGVNGKMRQTLIQIKVERYWRQKYDVKRGIKE